MADSRDWRDWVRYAENDWRYAQGGLEEFPAQAGYLLYQSAEKYLKAALLGRGAVPPRSHDLQELLGLIEPGLAAGTLEWSAASLFSRLYPANRYPADLPEPTGEEALALSRAAEVLRTFARTRLGL